VRELVGAMLLRHVCQLVSNAHAITALRRSKASEVLSDGEVSRAVDVSEQVRLATAIYPTTSLMNHSCDPSIISRYSLA